MAVPEHLGFYIDPNRCIGCQACVQACTECDTHRGETMIHLEYVSRAVSGGRSHPSTSPGAAWRGRNFRGGLYVSYAPRELRSMLDDIAFPHGITYVVRVE